MISLKNKALYPDFTSFISFTALLLCSFNTLPAQYKPENK